MSHGDCTLPAAGSGPTKGLRAARQEGARTAQSQPARSLGGSLDTRLIIPNVVCYGQHFSAPLPAMRDCVPITASCRCLDACKRFDKRTAESADRPVPADEDRP